jgi:asparagine synthase (glutamine-hydrolysing)
MCGIAGLISGGARSNPSIVHSMIGALAHRGPDDEGVWTDPAVGIGLGHRRLSIVDLSPAGHEPMLSSSERFVITFNGEIYNHVAIRARLEGESCPRHSWRGHSDVETFLEAIDRWGLDRALNEAAGMFAFALWDRQKRQLTIVRDRFGEKPVYYGWVGNDFVFASELKAIRAHPQFDGEIDPQAISLFASRNYIPAPLSIYRRIYKLPPGSLLNVSSDVASIPLDEAPDESSKDGPRLERYWSYRKVVAAGLAAPIRQEADALAELDAVLTRAVADQSIADVPVGMFLSGGIDSSTIAAYYQRISRLPVRTFSIGFNDSTYNEAPFASSVAKHLGTIHHEEIVTDRDALETIPLLPTIYDEPFADSSQIPTYLVSRMARSEVKVALTGDGGDELFGGYHRHFYAPRLWRQISRIPAPVRRIGAPLSLIPTRFWRGASGLFPRVGRSHLGPAIQDGLRAVASARNIDDIYASFLDEWRFERSPVLGSRRIVSWDMEVGSAAPDEARIMYCDAVTYLPDDILCKVDRASMAVSLETRVPFLDHRVAEVAARIPLDLKIKHGEGKRILRKLLYRDVPRELFQRPKAGFAIPVGKWLTGPLRGWAEELLDERRLRSEGWFDSMTVRRRWSDHLSGRRESTPAIWAILMFQAWLDEQRGANNNGRSASKAA